MGILRETTILVKEEVARPVIFEIEALGLNSEINNGIAVNKIIEVFFKAICLLTPLEYLSVSSYKAAEQWIG